MSNLEIWRFTILRGWVSFVIILKSTYVKGGGTMKRVLVTIFIALNVLFIQVGCGGGGGGSKVTPPGTNILGTYEIENFILSTQYLPGDVTDDDIDDSLWSGEAIIAQNTFFMAFEIDGDLITGSSPYLINYTYGTEVGYFVFSDPHD